MVLISGIFLGDCHPENHTFIISVAHITDFLPVSTICAKYLKLCDEYAK